jgi:type III pantothenate kinase
MKSLAIDVGNTSTTLALVERGMVSCVHAIRGGIEDLSGIEAAITAICSRHEPCGAALSSVVPAVNQRWFKLIKHRLGIELLVIDHTLNLSVGIDYPKPASIGADRLANACGAVFKYGAPVIVADFGTALTFDVIDRRHAYVGGVIAPGMPLMTDYLADRTALLPLINPRGRCGRVGRSTEGAMRIGARIGYRGMVREITGHLTQSKGTCNAALCATGGFAAWVLKNSGLDYQIDENLTLRGIGVIYDLNR